MRETRDTPEPQPEPAEPTREGPAGESSVPADWSSLPGGGAGKRSPVQRRYAAGTAAAPVGDTDTRGQAHAIASAGVQGSGSPLPDLDAIQSSFGRHDVSGIQAHIGGEAATASEAIGAEAYATDNHVAFRGTPDLHTAAHEAAHVVQQRGGVQLQGGFDIGDDTYERNADAVADAVVAGDSAEGLLDPFAGSSSVSARPVQRKVVQRDRGQRPVLPPDIVLPPAGQKEPPVDIFPGPVTVSMVGDPFVIRLSRESGKLTVTFTYAGPYPADVQQPNTFDLSVGRAITIHPDHNPRLGVDPPDEKTPYNARIVQLSDRGAVFDLYGDGAHILEVLDAVDGSQPQRFDKRRHLVSARLNGYPSMPGFMWLALPAGEGDRPQDGEHVAASQLTLNNDHFTLRARRHGDSKQVVLSLMHERGDSLVMVPLKSGAPIKLSMSILRNDGREIEVDLDEDGRADAKLIHTVNAVQPPGGRMGMSHPSIDIMGGFGGARGEGPYYIHNVAAYDADGVRVGTMVHKMLGYAGVIPPAQDERQNPAPKGNAMPDDRAPLQGDIPGEGPTAFKHLAGDWEIRIDADGDRTKELLLRIVPGGGANARRSYHLHAIHMTSNGAAENEFSLTDEQASDFDQSGPALVEANDGRRSAGIRLGSNDNSPVLRIWRDLLHLPDNATYHANVDGKQEMAFILPGATNEPGEGLSAPLTTKKIGGITSSDFELTEYRDKFRVTVEKVDGGNVLLGVAAIGAEGPVGGFSTRLFDINEPYLDPGIVNTASEATFFVKPDIMEPNLRVSSALDPARDAQGRVIPDAPPSAHRDHRIDLSGPSILGIPQHTFRVRDGRFVSGWAESPDDRRAASASQSVGVLEEQLKHPSVGEFRIHLDAGLDAEVARAQESGWIPADTAESWAKLKEDMIFIQALEADKKTDRDRAENAALRASTLGSWMVGIARKEAIWKFQGGHVRRLAPGEAVGPGGATPEEGNALNQASGQELFATKGEKDGLLYFGDELKPGWGLECAEHLGAGAYVPALQSYQKFRSGMGVWLSKKYETDPKYGKDSPEVNRLQHMATLSDRFAAIEGVDHKLKARDVEVDIAVGRAVSLGFIDGDTAAAWSRLVEDMALIAGSAQSGSAPEDSVKRATADAASVGAWLEREKGDKLAVAPHGAALGLRLASHEYALALQSYRRLREGVLEQLAVKARSDAPNDVDLDVQGYAASVTDLSDKNKKTRPVTRVAATFHADESYEKMPDKGTYKQADFGLYRQVPLQVFVWAENGKWHLRDMHNTRQPVWIGECDFDGEDEPPEKLFKTLDHKRHLPKGWVHYALPSGAGGQIRCEYAKEWYEYVAEIAMILAAVGLVFLTLGAATPLVVGAYATAAFALSSVAGIIAASGELADGLDHGFADDKMILLNCLDIAANVFSLGSMAAGKLVMGAAKAATAAKAGTGAAWTGAMAWMAKAGSMVYRPLMFGGMALDGIQLLVMAHDLEAKLDEIDKTVHDPGARTQAKALLIAQAAVQGGLFIMSVKGDLPDLAHGSPNIVLDKMNGITVARIGDVKLGKETIHLPEGGDPNTHAMARWQAEDIELKAQHSRNPDAKARASEVLDDVEFRDAYQNWMKQPKRIEMVDGKPRLLLPENTPPRVRQRIEELVDTGEINLYEKAFARADEIEKIRTERKGRFDIDPKSEDWPQVKEKLRQDLGGGKRADETIARYEHARMGSEADPSGFLSDRQQINQVLPDSELERIKNVFPEFECYMTRDPVKFGGEVVEVTVVVKNGTEAATMSAIEQRAAGFQVHADPNHVDTRRLPDNQNKPLKLRAKVVSEDQFFGLATARVKGPGAPRYHDIGADVGGALGLGDIPVRSHPGGDYSVDVGDLSRAHDVWKKGPHADDVSKLQYDRVTHTMYFEVHGGGTRPIRIQAALPARITTAGDWSSLSNRIIGNKAFRDLNKVQNIARAAVKGDFSQISKELGVELPDGVKLGDGLELGIGKMPDGTYVVVKGGIGEVDWSSLPGVEPIAHTHPHVPKGDPAKGEFHQGNDLNPDMSGQERVSLEDLATPSDGPVWNRDVVLPTGADVDVMARKGRREHRVITGFIVKDGHVMKAPPGYEGKLLEFRIVNAVEAGSVNGVSVSKATIVGVFDGREVLHLEVHAKGAAAGTADMPGDVHGQIYMGPPPGFVPKNPAVSGPVRPGAGEPQRSFKTYAEPDLDAARVEANRLADSNPKKMTDAEIKADKEAYGARKQIAREMYEQAGLDPDLLPPGISHERLRLAVIGDPVTGQRIPLNYGADIAQAKKTFAELQADVKAAFQAEGITDAVVVQLGSATTGWSTAPGKERKMWTPKSDVDFAIFSDQALVQAHKLNVPINPKNKQEGKFTTLKNKPEDGKGFYDTPLGKRLEKVAKKWNEKVYGDPDIEDGFDFKLNLQSAKPFKSAVPVLQAAKLEIKPVTPGATASSTRAVQIPGAGDPYFGVTVADPRIVLPPTMGRREYHITVLSPPELKKVMDDPRLRSILEAGADIPGQPQPGQVGRHDIEQPNGQAAYPAYQLEVSWPEAQELRAKLGLQSKQFHVSLNGGVGKAVRARDAAKGGTHPSDGAEDLDAYDEMEMVPDGQED